MDNTHSLGHVQPPTPDSAPPEYALQEPGVDSENARSGPNGAQTTHAAAVESSPDPGGERAQLPAEDVSPTAGVLSEEGRVNITISPSGVIGITGLNQTASISSLSSLSDLLLRGRAHFAQKHAAYSTLPASTSPITTTTTTTTTGTPTDTAASTPPIPITPIPITPDDFPTPDTARAPRLNILMQIIGSRGDIQPFLSLALVLAKPPYSHRIRLATHACFEKFITEVATTHSLHISGGYDGFGGSIEFYPLAGDPAVLMSYMVRNPGLIPSSGFLSGGEIRERRKGVWEILLSTWESCYKPYPVDPLHLSPPFTPNVIVANPPGFGHLHCAERLGVPLHIMFTMPWSPPTHAFPHPLANLPTDLNKRLVGRAIDEGTINYLTYSLLDILTWQGTGDLINKFRTSVLGIDSLNSMLAPTLMGRLAEKGVVPHTYCWSPALIPKPRDWETAEGEQAIQVSGFWFLDLQQGYVPPRELVEFIQWRDGREVGKPLIYIGFGSIVAPNPAKLTDIVLKAIELAGVRALVSKGWGTISPPEGYANSDVFFLGDTPHDYLFPLVSLAIHHGGAGTTAAAIKAGIPSVVVPFFGDQKFWGDMVMRRGAGGGVCPAGELAEEKLVEMIRVGLGEEVRNKARELGTVVRNERGEEVAARGLLKGVENRYGGSERAHGWCQVEERMPAYMRPKRMGLGSITIQRTGKNKRKGIRKGEGSVRVSPRTAHILAHLGLINLANQKQVTPTRWMEYDPAIREHTETDPATGGAGALLGTIISMSIAGAIDFDRGVWFPAKATPAGVNPKVISNALDADKQKLAMNADAGMSEAEKDKGPAWDLITLHNILTAHKPLSGIITSGLKSPIDLSLSVSRGFHNLPQTLGSETVRPLPPVHTSVTGIASGVTVASKYLATGIYDGITGLYTQPAKGWEEGGVVGAVMGFGRGLVGVVTKPAAGGFGVGGYLGVGVMKEMEKLRGGRKCDIEVRENMLYVVEWALVVSEDEKVEVMKIWRDLVGEWEGVDVKGTGTPLSEQEMVEAVPSATVRSNKSSKSSKGKGKWTKLDELAAALSASASSQTILEKLRRRKSEAPPPLPPRPSVTTTPQTMSRTTTDISELDAAETEIRTPLEEFRSRENSSYQHDEGEDKELRSAILASLAEPSLQGLIAGEEDEDLKRALLESLQYATLPGPASPPVSSTAVNNPLTPLSTSDYSHPVVYHELPAFDTVISAPANTNTGFHAGSSSPPQYQAEVSNTCTTGSSSSEGENTDDPEMAAALAASLREHEARKEQERLEMERLVEYIKTMEEQS